MHAVNYQPLTPLSFLERSARVFPDRLAVIDGDNRLTYRQFQDLAQALATGIRHLGVGPGDRVAFLALNGFQLLAAHYGVPLSGGVLVALNTRLAHAEIATILRHSGATVLVCDPALLPDPGAIKLQCPDLHTVVSLTGESDGAIAWNALVALGTQMPFHSLPVDEQGLITLNYTSGTTGDPKGVMYNHRGAYLNALGSAVEIGLTSDTKYLWTLPMFHCNGWCYTWSVTAVGGTHICLPKVVPDQVFRLAAEHQVTHLCAAPTVLIDLAAFAEREQIRLQTYLLVVTGGASPQPQVIRNMEAVGAGVIHAYGLTETYGPSTFCQWRSEWDSLPFDQQAGLKARQGVADLMVQQRVIRPDMTDVVANGAEMGELVIRGNVVMQGYYKDPEATRKAFEGGWFHTGDLAVMHPDQYVEIRDRLKDVIISGGENISTIEVERVIFTHPAVLEVSVVGVPHVRWGEVPTAFVVLRAGAALTPAELDSFCRQHLAGFKCPKFIHVVPALPKTSTGKIQKYVLRSMEKERVQGGFIPNGSEQ